MAQITVPDVVPEIEYAVTTSSTGPFEVPFAFFDTADVFVSLVADDGTVTLLTQTTNWTFTRTDAAVDGEGYSGGEITLVAAVENTTVRIYRDTVIDRLVNYPQAGPISIQKLNDELNMVTMILQELERQRARYISLDLSAGDNTAWNLAGRPAGNAGEGGNEDTLATNRQVDASGPNWLADDNAETPLGANGQWNTMYSAAAIPIQGTVDDDGTRTFDLLTEFFTFIQNRGGAEASFYIRYRYQVDCYAQVTKIANSNYPIKLGPTEAMPFSFMDIEQDIDYTNGNCTLLVGIDVYPLDANSADLWMQWGNLAVNTSEPR